MKKIIFFLLFILVACFSINAQDSLKQYIGKYSFPEGSVVSEIDVVFKDSGLIITSSVGEAAIKKTGEDIFTIPTYGNGTIWFFRNETKKVNGIKIDALGALLEGPKEETEINNYDRIDIIYSEKIPQPILLPAE